MKTRQYYSKTIFLSFITFLFGMTLVTNTQAGDLKKPQLPIEVVSNKLKGRLQDESFSKDFEQITQFVEESINPYVDFNRISALVLGKLWRKATPEQKQRFKQEFHTLLVRTYSRAFVEFNDWSVRFLPLRMEQGAKKVIVKTEILQPGIQPLAVNYRMVLVKENWKVYDIMIEGVSLVTNYRTSIKNEYNKSGSLNAVIDLLAKRNNQAGQNNQS